MEQEFKFCKHCGAKLSQNSTFCDVCGKRVEEVAKTTLDKKRILTIVKNTLPLIIVLFGFLTLLFNLVKVSSNILETNINEKLTGYNVLGRPKALDGVGSWFLICSVIHLIITSILSIITISKFINNKLSNKFCHIICIISLILALLFLFNGIGALSLTLAEVGYAGKLVKITTTAYIPFIIQLILYISYILCNKYNKKFD